MVKFKFLFVACVLLLSPTAAWAAASCTINTSNGPAFGSYDSIGPNATSPMDATGTISIQCNGAADDLNISFDQGAYAAAGSTCALPLRQMASGTGRLRYNLYSDAARSVVWGCTFASSVHRVLGNGASTTSLTIYARVPAAQTPTPGSYADTVGMNVTF